MSVTVDKDKPVGIDRVPQRTVLVHEWMVRWGGSESVLHSMHRLFPTAPIHTLVFRPDARTAKAFAHARIIPSQLDRIPIPSYAYRYALPFMPEVWRSADMGDADLVLSSSHAFAKGARASGALHVSYCHTPPRYLWDLTDDYVPGLLQSISRHALRRLQQEDLESAERVDHFIANSRFVAGRISETYGREADVIHPPVDTHSFESAIRREGSYFLAGGRLVGYKRTNLAIRAANEGRLPLIVFGDGPALRHLKRLAGPTVRFAGQVGRESLLELLGGAWAFLFPGIEDFGILPVEAQAAGVPVVARAEGGALETVVDGETGILYPSDGSEEVQVQALLYAMRAARDRSWSLELCRANARRFSRSRFEDKLRSALRRLTEPSATQRSSR